MPRRALQSVGGSIESPGREKKVVQGGGVSLLACLPYVWRVYGMGIPVFFFLSFFIYMWVYDRWRLAYSAV